jgi:N-hydroxyarylamine O-acetyltransferase
MLDVSSYLQRIQYNGSLLPSESLLNALHKRHLQNIPYENFDIVTNKPLSLVTSELFDKIVVRGRGGFCYELNILFGQLLQTLGFRVRFLSAHLWKDEAWGAEYDHLILAVSYDANKDKRVWLADVGNARWFQQPIQLHHGSQHTEYSTTYRLRKENELYFFTKQESNFEEQMQYRFTMQAHNPNDFSAMCLFKETSAESWFRQNIIYAQCTDMGRIRLSNSQYSVVIDGVQTDLSVATLDEFKAIFQRHWAGNIPPNLDHYFSQPSNHSSQQHIST